jgi:hypothetical protein
MVQRPKAVIAEVDPSLRPVAGLVPAIHAFRALGGLFGEDVGGRNKSGHGVVLVTPSTMAQWVSTRRM